MKNIRKTMQLGVLSSVIILGFNGCNNVVQPIVNRPIVSPPLNLNYILHQSQNMKTNKIIVILSPKAKVAEAKAKIEERKTKLFYDMTNTDTSIVKVINVGTDGNGKIVESPPVIRKMPQVDPNMGAFVAQMTQLMSYKIQKAVGEFDSCNFDNMYYQAYEEYFLNSFKNKLSDIIQTKGFVAISKYKKYTDIPLEIKKKAYLIIEPDVYLNFSKNSFNYKKIDSKYTEKGQMNLSGIVKLNYIESLSKEKIDTLSINGTDVRGIKNNYICQQNIGEEKGISLFNLEKITSSNNETDTSRIILSDSLNNFFNIIMEEINNKVVQKDILAYSKNIQKIKNIKVK